MSKSKVKSGKPAKTTDVLTKVKSGSVTKPATDAKSKSKKIANTFAKEQKSNKKSVKAPAPSDSEDSDSDSSASSASESETEVKKPVANGKAKAAKAAVKPESDSESDSGSEDDSESEDEAPKTNGVSKALPAAESDSDDSDASSEESESEDEKPAVSAVMGAKLGEEDDDEDGSSDESESDDEAQAVKQAPKTNGLKKEAEDDSEDDSSEESDSEDEVPAVKSAPKTNGVAKAGKVESEDDSSEQESDSDSSDSDESDKEETEAKPPATKRKAVEEPERATKKAKAEEEAANGPNLFVGNLSWNVTEEWLREEFEGFGELSGVRLMTDRSTGRSKGFGYVEFALAADAAKAHAAKSGADLDGRPMNVDFANSKPNDRQKQETRSKTYGDSISEPNDTLFLGNLHFDVTADLLTEEFSPFGSIQGIRLPTDQETERPRGFGYITFASIEESKAALEAMNGHYVLGRPIRIDFTAPKARNNDSPRGGFGGRGRGGFNSRGGRGGGDRGRGRGGFGGRGGRGASTNRGGFGDFSGKKTTF